MHASPLKIVDTRHGRFIVDENDMYVCKSLIKYGEYCPKEVNDLCRLSPEGGWVIEVGANFGAITVPLAFKVGPMGRIIAFEPLRFAYQALCGTLALNDIQHVDLYREGIGARHENLSVPMFSSAAMQAGTLRGHQFNLGSTRLTAQSDTKGPVEQVRVRPLDSLSVPRLDLIKVDVEGMEQDVLAGAQKTFDKHQPVLFIENNQPALSAALISAIENMGYVCFWHSSHLYAATNWRKDPENIFDKTIALNMVCLPESDQHRVQGFVRALPDQKHPFDQL